MEAAGGHLQDDYIPSDAIDIIHPAEPATYTIAEDEGDNCRICRGEGTDAQPLFYPCKCSGSIKFVHQDCLMEWLAHSQKKYCELCKTPFRFTKLYDQSMPSTLPLPLFLQQMAIHSIRAISKWTRCVLVGFVWLCWLPWSIRQVWRGLFWLADGSWVSYSGLRDATIDRVADIATLANDGTLNALSTMSEPMNATLRDAIFRALPQVVAPISGFLGLTSGEFLLVRIVRILYPSLFHWSFGIGPTNATSGDNYLSLYSDRQPSLLSDVKFLKSLTGYSILDNATVDIFEGQLICLVIITAFILVFLIREWVINQQPILNMPDPDRAEEAVAPVPLHDEAGQPVRRRRRGLRRGLDQPNPAQHPVVANAPRVVVEPVLRRAATEDNLTRPTAARFAEQSSTLPVRSASFTGEATHIEMVDASGSLSVFEHIEGPESTAEVRPSLLPRGGFDDAANIRRILEEGPENREREARTPDELQIPATLLSVTPISQTQGGSTDSLQTLLDRGSLHPLTSQEPIEVGDLTLLSYPLELTEGPFEVSSITANDGFDDSDEELRLPQSDSSGEIGLLTPTSTGPDSSASASTPSVGDQDEGLAEDQTPEVHPVQLGRPSIVELIAAWLWHVDAHDSAFTGAPLAADEGDDEHIVEDLEAEEPFVPVNRADRNAPENPNHGQPLIADPPEPNIAFGIDLNNPDAIDDAEDLDGILELIGVHGPIAGMVQNVIFSEFLITLTIAASVWLPYIWGKITLLILANPVGVFVKAPLYLASKTADAAVDLLIFISGLLGYAFSSCGHIIILLLRPLFPALGSVHYIQDMSWNFAKSSGGRLEKALSLTAHGLKPDLPSFSMQSHHALRVFKQWTSSLLVWISSQSAADLMSTLQQCLKSITSANFNIYDAFRQIASLPQTTVKGLLSLEMTVQELVSDLRPLLFSDLESIDLALVKWNTQDKSIAIFLGYLFFAFLGFMYLKISRLVLGLKPEEKVEGVVADSLRQAGGVMKVVVIIGIEMIAFPLYCGLLLDVALMPLFHGVTLQSRIAFMLRAPITGLFVHWFIGTCYMFHFALFVSMCRKIMRKGVLYFIRDPDDPTFHPVRDVLERPVATQLGKIAFSALIYGGLVILCLGGVVWTVSGITGVLPINWATNEPRLAFPIDVIFYNFMLPFIIRKAEPSKKISAMYEWWLRGCAGGLRLTHFLFGEEKEEEKGTHVRRTWAALLRRSQGDVKKPIIGEDRRILAEDREVDTYFYRDGTYVRTPANDTVRIPKGGRVFVEVNENNERVDGTPDQDKGMHGKTDERFTKVYVPPNFRARIATFIFLLWIFAALTGVAFTVGPLLVGRVAIQWTTNSTQPPNDLYALTVGLHVCGVIAYALGYRRVFADWLTTNAGHYLKNIRQALPQLYSTAKYALGLLYFAITFGIILPFAISFLTEIYLHVPVYSYLLSRPRNPSAKTAMEVSDEAKALPVTVYILQTWTLGLLYFRLAMRTAMLYPCPHAAHARAIRAVLRDGYTRPDIKLATRAVVIPASALFVLLLLGPLSIAKLLVSILHIQDTATRTNVYRFAYPGLLAAGLAVHGAMLLKRQVAGWRVKIRDEVYLIGERLHNFKDDKKSLRTGLKSKGKQRARVVVVDD